MTILTFFFIYICTGGPVFLAPTNSLQQLVEQDIFVAQFYIFSLKTKQVILSFPRPRVLEVGRLVGGKLNPSGPLLKVLGGCVFVFLNPGPIGDLVGVKLNGRVLPRASTPGL